jgi:glycosyltransferase involved in cell wall biosynthesis
LICKLQEKGYAIHVSCLNREGPLINFLAGQDIREYRLKKFFHYDTLVKVIKFRNDLRKKRIKILHCHDFYTNVFGTVAGRLAGVPIIINSRRDMGHLIRPSQHMLQRIIFKMSTHIVSNASAIRRNVVEREGIPREKTSVIYNGIDHVPSINVQGFRNHSKALHIGMIANFNLPVKGHSYFLRAADIVVRKVRDMEFVLAGDGPLRKDMQQLAKELGIEERIQFLGRIPPSEFFNRLDLLVSASLSEGLSNSIIEAMARGIPVVATRVGGNVELIENNQRGLLVEPSNSQALAEAILWMVGHPAKAYEMGLCGKRFIEEHFSWETNCSQYLLLYHSLLNQTPSGGIP